MLTLNTQENLARAWQGAGELEKAGPLFGLAWERDRATFGADNPGR